MSFLPSLGGFVCSTMGVSVDNIRGLVLALSSSLFIGSSFIVKKKGLKRAGAHGVRAGSGGFSYLYEPLWWVGMLTMILGEIANFAAYAFAPAILVTPLGALSIIVSAVLAHFFLNEKLHIFGVLGCVLCVVGSVSIVLHAPVEKDIESVKEVWYLATEPGFIVYFCVVMFLVVFLIFHLVPRYGQTNLVVYVGICSLMGSLTVMSVKAVGIALKLTLSGMNQFVYAQTWFFTAVVAICCLIQMNYLNKALDTFNTAVISPVYYVMFTTLTIFASMIMFKDWASQNASQILTEICGFVTILSGTFLLHKTMDMGESTPMETIALGFGSESRVSAPVPMDRSRRCPRFGRLFSIALFLLILLASNSSLALAQELETDNGENASAVMPKSLDRRTKMLLRPFRKDEDASWEGVVSLDQTGLGLFDAFFASFSMIIVSEIGDETFIIAALMAMRHPKSIVLSGALTALFVMTVLSTGLGRIVPNLISRKHTNSAATVLYAFFGLRLLYIAWRSDSKTSQKKEMEETTAAAHPPREERGHCASLMCVEAASKVRA
ncbi:hypothetical protein MUK42_17477 [Musa troglodytarum]|uniref:Probable magnesium transporter n=2 Tax=Musa troglodytarum TaxID=320322 RepID=A0A9E7KQG8_9LILI|nr:hypothetical protein MUK42_17477 [Musa troglodytarum]